MKQKISRPISLVFASAATACACFLTSGCISKDEHQSVVQKNTILESRVSDLEREAKKKEVEFRRDLEKKNARLKGKDAAILEVEQKVEALEKQLKEVLREFEKYKAEYKLGMRKKAEGRAVGTFVAADGVEYQSASYKTVTPDGIQLMHASGVAMIKFENLPQAVIDEFGFSAEETAQYREDLANAGVPLEITQVAELHKMVRQNASKQKIKLKTGEVRKMVAMWSSQIQVMEKRVSDLKRRRENGLASGGDVSSISGDIKDLVEKIGRIKKNATAASQYLKRL